MSTQESCTICLQSNSNELITTSCEHKFHNQCLYEWLKVRNTCPVCRHNILESTESDNESVDTIVQNVENVLSIVETSVFIVRRIMWFVNNMKEEIQENRQNRRR